MKKERLFYTAGLLALIAFFGLQASQVRADDLVNVHLYGDTTAQTVAADDTKMDDTTLHISNDAEVNIIPKTGMALEAGVDGLIADTLAKSITPSKGEAFCTALVDSFNAQNADVRTSFAWNEGSYSRNLEASSELSADQKVLFQNTKDTIADTNELLGKVNAGGDDAIYRVIVRSSLISLSGEFKKEGGPDAARVNNLNQIISGSLGCMGAGSNSSDEENLKKVKDSIISLSNSWDEKKGNFGDTSVKAEATIEDVTIPYKESAKLFGFISSHLTSKAVVATDGTLTVKRPWYRFLFSQKDHMDATEIEKSLQDQKVDLKASTTVDARTKALDTLSTVLKGEAETDASATENMK